MSSTYQMPHSPTLRKKFEAGLAEGKAKEAVKRERKTVHRLLKARGLTPTEEQSASVEACEDLATLELWSERAETATSTDDVFK